MTEMTGMAKAWSAVVAEKNAEIALLRAQRDHLLAAVKEIITELPMRLDRPTGWQGECLKTIGELARAAIAAVEEKP